MTKELDELLTHGVVACMKHGTFHYFITCEDYDEFMDSQLRFSVPSSNVSDKKKQNSKKESEQWPK